MPEDLELIIQTAPNHALGSAARKPSASRPKPLVGEWRAISPSAAPKPPAADPPAPPKPNPLDKANETGNRICHRPAFHPAPRRRQRTGTEAAAASVTHLHLPASSHLKDYGPDPDRPENLDRRQSYADYLTQMAAILAQICRATASGGKPLPQAANIKPAGLATLQVVPLHWDLPRLLMDATFLFYDEIIWLKKESCTGSTGGRPLFGSYLYLGNPKMLNQLWKNISVITKSSPAAAPAHQTKEASRLTRDEWPHGVWRIEIQHNPAHPAAFNAEPTERVALLYSFRGETVLDPILRRRHHGNRRRAARPPRTGVRATKAALRGGLQPRPGVATAKEALRNEGRAEGQAKANNQILEQIDASHSIEEIRQRIIDDHSKRMRQPPAQPGCRP